MKTNFECPMANLMLKIKVMVIELLTLLWYKFPYASKVITSTRNRTDDDDADDDRNKKKAYRPNAHLLDIPNAVINIKEAYITLLLLL